MKYKIERFEDMLDSLPISADVSLGFEVEVPGRPSIQPRVLEALAPDARGRFLAFKVRMSDTARLKKNYGTETSPMAGAFKKEMEFEREFVKAGGTLLAGEDPTGIGGVLAGFGDQRERGGGRSLLTT